jgi:hypothetical protein
LNFSSLPIKIFISFGNNLEKETQLFRCWTRVSGQLWTSSSSKLLSLTSKPFPTSPLPKKIRKQNSAGFLKLPWNFQKVKLLGPYQSGMWIPWTYFRLGNGNDFALNFLPKFRVSSTEILDNLQTTSKIYWVDDAADTQTRNITVVITNPPFLTHSFEDLSGFQISILPSRIGIPELVSLTWLVLSKGEHVA